MIKKIKLNPNSENFGSTLHFVQTHKFSEVYSFLKQIIKGVINGVLFDYT